MNADVFLIKQIDAGIHRFILKIINLAATQEMRQQVAIKLEDKIIRKSCSSYCIPALLVSKKMEKNTFRGL